MTHLRGPSAFYQIATLILDQLNTDLGDNAVDRVAIYPGDIAWDDCDCGTLQASIGNIYLTDNFPDPVTVWPCAGAFFAATLTIAVARCAPAVEDGGVAPSVADINASAALITSDLWHLNETTDCVLGGLAEEPRIVNYLMRPGTTIGPQGDCVGSMVQAIVAIHRGQNVSP